MGFERALFNSTEGFRKPPLLRPLEDARSMLQHLRHAGHEDPLSVALIPLPSGVSARGLISTRVQSLSMNIAYMFFRSVLPCTRFAPPGTSTTERGVGREGSCYTRKRPLAAHDMPPQSLLLGRRVTPKLLPSSERNRRINRATSSVTMK